MSEVGGEVGAAYRGVRQRVTSLVAETDEARQVIVPACPQWRVHDLVSHMAGVVDDLVAGRLEGVGSDTWTSAQVEARRGRAMPDILDEWAELAPQVEAVLDLFGPPGRQAVMDAVTHEHDLRGAVGLPGSRDSDAVDIGLHWLMRAMTGAAAAAHLPPMLLRTTGGREWSFGDGDPTATVTSTSFELLRACSGRRSVEEIVGLDWEGNVEAVLPAFSFGPFAPCPTSLAE